MLIAGCRQDAPPALQGRALYESNGCAGCHGREGHGDGPLASTLDVKPTDFRSEAAYTRGADEDSIVKTLAEGIGFAPAATAQLHHTHHELVMPKFDHLPEAERRAIALYLISLRSRH